MDALSAAPTDGDATARRSTAIAAIVFGLAGLAWIATELAPVAMGFEDTDSADIMLRFLAAHPAVYATGGIALFTMSGSLIVAAVGFSRLLSGAGAGLVAPVSAAVGVVAAAMFALHAALRLSGGPLLYIDGLDHELGRAGYTAHQLLGQQGAVQAGVLAVCAWAVVVAVSGLRRGVLALWISILAVVPALRIAILAGPFLPPTEASSILWFASIATIPGSAVWCVLLGVSLLVRRRTSVAAAGQESPAA